MRILAGCLALSLLAGCSAVQQAMPPAPKTPQQTVYEVKAALVSAEDAGLAFAAQVCPTPILCRDPRVKAVTDAIVSADTVMNAAEAAVRADKPDTPAAQAAAIDAQAALAALQKVLAQYGVQTTTSGGK